MFLRLVCLILATVLVYGQTKHCCTPMQWESVNDINMGKIATGTKKAVYTEGVEMASIDQTNHRVAGLATLTTGGFKVNVQVVQLFDQGKQYVVESGECKESALPAWIPKGVPDNATLLTQTYYGTGSSKIDIDVYQVISGPNTVFLAMGHADCSPVSQSAFGSASGISGMSIKTYGNITLGIKDTSVFDVPAICRNATLVPTVELPHHGLF